MNMNMNRLPVPTWNHLGVNFAPDKAVSYTHLTLPTKA